MASRFQTVPFDDFSETQLRSIWATLCEDGGWHCSAKVSDVAARRLARGIGRKGFGNARSVRNLFDRAVSEAKLRYLAVRNKEKQQSVEQRSVPSIELEDVIGKEPNRETIPELDAALSELDRKTGLGEVKDAIFKMFQLARSNYQKELRNERIDDMPLNRLFLGNPGTGKTTIAGIYGRILKALRFLSKGEVVYKTASDFIGQHVGESQVKTASIIEQAQGKVLLIDEAYVLDDDLYGKQALDTIVEKVSGAPGEDIAVIMCSYESPMLKMLRDQNPGLSRRFNPSYALRFADFSDEELLDIFAAACRRDGLPAPIDVKMRAVQLIAKRRALPNFGNAGAVLSAYSDAKQRMSARLFKEGGARILTMVDVDESILDERKRDPMALLEDMMDVGGIKKHINEIGKQIKVRRREGRSTEGLVGHYVFTGAPGTGKTTVARRMGAVLHAFGVLATENVIVTSAMDLKAEFVGQTKKNVQEKMEAARGGVLFVDEAYELGTGDTFGKEAMTKLLSMLTEPDYMNSKTIVILAGYREDMNAMLDRNSGLKSRFTEYVHFDDWNGDKCVELFIDLANNAQPKPYEVSDGVKSLLAEGFKELRSRPGWANARDVIRMFKDVEKKRDMRIVEEDEPSSAIGTEDVATAITEFLQVRPMQTKEADNHDENAVEEKIYATVEQHSHHHLLKHHHRQVKSDKEKEQAEEQEDEEVEEEEIQEKKNLNEAEKEFSDLIELFGEDVREMLMKYNADEGEENSKEIEDELRKRAQMLADQDARNDAFKKMQELKRKREEAKRKREEELARLRKMEEERKRKIEETKRKLQEMYPCPAGYRWRHIEGNHYQCAGGSHFITMN